MSIFAIAKQYFSVIAVDFALHTHKLPINGRIINPRETFCKDDLQNYANPPDQDWLIFASLQEAMVTAVMMSRLYSDDSNLIARQIQQFASALIFRFRACDVAPGHFSPIDTDTLTLYPDFSTLPFYQFECFESERNYALQIIHAFKKSDHPLPKCRKQKISAQPVEIIYQNAMGEFANCLLQPAVVLPFKQRFIIAR